MLPDLSPHGRIFMTGGTGFFGKWLLRAFAELNRLSDEKQEIVVLSRSPERFLSEYPEYAKLPWLSFIKGDIMHCEFPTGEFTSVIHAGLDTGELIRIDPLSWFEQTIAGSRRVLEFAANSPGAKFLLTSSGAVYGAQSTPAMGGISEACLLAPDTTDIRSLYGETKRAAEQMCAIYHSQYGLHATIARCFAFVGEYLPLQGDFAIGNFIHDALHADVITVKGDGSPVRSYLYGRDLALWLLTILEKGESVRAYNVGSDREISMLALAKMVRDLIAPAKEVIVEGTRTGIASRPYYVPDISRSKEELGLAVHTDLEEAILRTAHAARKLGKKGN